MKVETNAKFNVFSHKFSSYRKIKMLELTMNIVYREAVLHQRSPISTRGHTQSLKSAQNHVVAVTSRETSLALNSVHQKLSTMDFAMRHKNLLNGRNVEFLTVHRNGLKANGQNVQHHVDRTVHVRERFIVKKSAQMGE